MKNPHRTKEAAVRIEPFVFRIESLMLGPIPPQVGEPGFCWQFVVHPIDHLVTDKTRRNGARYAANECDDSDYEVSGHGVKK